MNVCGVAAPGLRKAAKLSTDRQPDASAVRAATASSAREPGMVSNVRAAPRPRYAAVTSCV
eukprot:6204885-Pleurochrysis_carterae.AAC.2